MSKHLFSSLFAALCALAFSSSPAVSQTMANSSFEVDASSGNGSGAITGWPFTAGSGGINNSTGPFADNGAIPDGQKVAFIRLGGTMHQVVSGFTLGLQHRLYYYENDQQHGHYWQFGELLRWRVASCPERVLEYQQFNNLRQFGRICGRGVIGFNDTVTVTLTNTTVSHNAAFNGGGILLNSGGSHLILINSIVTDNTPARAGGGIYLQEHIAPMRL